MRRSLLTAAAAPLALLAGSQAFAETQITDSRTSPVQTSTANNGQPDNVAITSSGSVKVNGPVAVTVDSSNTLSNAGTIEIKDVDNSTSVLIQGGHTGAFTNTGTINNTESYTASDSNNDGIVDGPFAKGTGRYGVRLTGPAPFVGAFSNAGSIAVNGNNSYGVSLEAPLQGDLSSTTTIGVIGDNSYGLRETGGITGKVNLLGSVNGGGGGTVGASFEGDVTGGITLYGSIAASGYRTATRSPNPAANAGLLPEDLLQSGSALVIRGNLGKGLFIGAPPTSTVATDTTTDADGDGIVDSAEGSGSLTVSGSAPALLIGAGGKDVHFGAFGTGDNNYGLIVRGTISGNGVFDGRSGTAVQVGVAGGTVHLDGGLRNVGTITAQAYEQDATGIHLLSGTTAPQIRNEGTIGAQVTSAIASSSTALLLDAGSTSSSLVNAGVITAQSQGNLASSYAVIDRAGGISSVINTNVIQALPTPASGSESTTGVAVALDLSANTTGVSLAQNANSSTTITPTITGDILLGSGNDNVQIKAGNVTGALAFGAGSAVFNVSGATYRGAVTGSGPMAMSVSNGTLEDRSATTLQLTSLNVGDKAVLVVAADPAHNTATHLNVAGPATISSTASLGLYLASLPTGPQHYTVISSPNLTAPNTTLTATAPYLFVAGFTADTAAGTVDLDLRRRTAQEAGLNQAETAAYDPVYFALSKDTGIQRAFLAQTTQAGLTSALDQMLPDHAGGVFRALARASEAASAAAAEGPLGEERAGPTRAWTSEIVMHEDKSAGDALSYRTLGVGAVGGIESVSAKGDALGVRFGFVAANVRNPDLPSDNLLAVSNLNLGLYWRGAFGPLRADAQVSAGYLWTDGRREFLYSDSTGVVHRKAQANWNGYTLAGRVGLRYVANLGHVVFEPRVSLDYFREHESGYTESGGGDGFDLKVAGRSGSVLSATPSLVAGYEWGTGWRWRPQVTVGYRAVLSGDAGTTQAELASGGSSFLLASESLKESALFGRVGIRVYSDYLDLMIDGGVEETTDYTDVDVRLTAHTIF